MIGIGLWQLWPSVSPDLLGDSPAVHYACLYAVQSTLRTTSFPAVQDPAGGDDIALSTASIVVKKLPLEEIFKRTTQPLSLPCILITPSTTRVVVPPTAGPLTHDDYVRPVIVTMIMKDNKEPTLQVNLGTIALWQQQVTRAFHNQRLAGVSESVITHAEPYEYLIPAAWGNHLLATSVLLKCTTREPRGAA